MNRTNFAIELIKDTPVSLEKYLVELFNGENNKLKKILVSSWLNKDVISDNIIIENLNQKSLSNLLQFYALEMEKY